MCILCCIFEKGILCQYDSLQVELAYVIQHVERWDFALKIIYLIGETGSKKERKEEFPAVFHL